MFSVLCSVYLIVEFRHSFGVLCTVDVCLDRTASLALPWPRQFRALGHLTTGMTPTVTQWPVQAVAVHQHATIRRLFNISIHNRAEGGPRAKARPRGQRHADRPTRRRILDQLTTTRDTWEIAPLIGSRMQHRPNKVLSLTVYGKRTGTNTEPWVQALTAERYS